MDELQRDLSIDDLVWKRLEDQLNYYRFRSSQAKSAYLRVKLAQIVVGAAIPVLAASGVTGWVTPATAAIPVVAEGIQQLFQWHSTWHRCRSTAEALKVESFLYEAQVGPYTSSDRRALLAERLAAITDRETSEWASSSKGEIDKQKKPR
ncbi:DUF4231 domain-containing protein [Nocardia sp. 2YAB30]|uniref:DUF4231 domain-containing protein n=1 Tax=unclassified Nocardia TaxID=2637762 RepID=UPI003F9B73FE